MSLSGSRYASAVGFVIGNDLRAHDVHKEGRGDSLAEVSAYTYLPSLWPAVCTSCLSFSQQTTVRWFGFRGVEMKQFLNRGVRAVRLMSRTTRCLLCCVLVAAASHAQIGFQTTPISGHGLQNPTTLQFGPDGRLYVGQQNGLIKAYTILRNGTANYQIVGIETITAVRSMPNRNDDGSLNAAITDRQVTAIYVTGTATNPVIYVPSSDPRIVVNGTNPPSQTLDTNSGVLSRLTWNGSSWQKVDLVRGLPRSEENHSSNGLTLDPSSNLIYMMQGGHTNTGSPSLFFSKLPEYALSAALLTIDLNVIGSTTYDLPTLNDEDRPGVNDANDPFGGNDGKNQAILENTGPVQIYSPGWRNAYDIVLTSKGFLYTVDNGANAGFGAWPTNCSNAVVEGGSSFPDGLHLISGPGYYGGHPNPTRGSQSNTFNNSNPQSPVPFANPTECNFISPGSNGSLATFTASTNGLVEYTASNFSGALQGDLLTASHDGLIYRIPLAVAGNALSGAVTPLFSGFGSIPLDVTAQGDFDTFPGTVWAVTYGNNGLTVFEPDDFSGGGPNCQGTYDPLLDEDGDQYSNSDEIDNGTDPCSAASQPPDWDQDFLSDLNDPDDDNDGLSDTADRLALDAANGATTSLPINLTWNNGEPPRGGILNLGFTGLMHNGMNYADLYDEDKIIPGGAPGVLSLVEVSEGDAFESLNDQEYGFQLGVDVSTSTPPFVIESRLLGPFAGFPVEDEMAFGVFFGNGDQDNFVEISAVANGGAGGLRFAAEVAGLNTSVVLGPGQGADILGANEVVVFLRIDPASQSATASAEIDGGATISLGTTTFPQTWLTASNRATLGVLSTSRGASAPFAATWDYLLAYDETTPSGQTLYRVNAGGPLVAATDSGPDWSADTSASPSPYSNVVEAASQVFAVTRSIDTSDPSIPPATPMELFQSERWDHPNGVEMQWSFPVTSGTYIVRMYFAEIFFTAPGARTFDVRVEGTLTLDDLDAVALVGADAGMVTETLVAVSDGSLDIDFERVIENPAVKAIEIEAVSTSGNNPPTVTNPGAQTSLEGHTVSLQIVATDADGDPLTYSASGLPPALTINQSTGLITGDTNTAGTYSVTVIVDDGTDQTPVSFTWTVNPPPIGTVIYRINAGGRAGPGWDSDLAANPSQYSNVAAASSQTFTVNRQIDTSHTSIPAGTPIGPFRSHRFDPPQGADMSWSFPVSSGSYLVRLYFAETFFTQAGQRIFDVMLEGAPFLDDLDVHSLVGADTAVAFTQTVTVADDVVDIDFSRVVGDPMLSGVEIESVPGGGNTPPAVTNPGPQQSLENDTIALQIVATDADGNPLTYSATGLPPTLTINPTTGLITGNTTTAGNYSVIVTVTDGIDPTPVSFSWTVDPLTGNTPPTVTNPGSQQSLEDDTISLQIVATDADGDPLTYSATGLPPTLTISPTTGLITGTTTTAGNYSVTVTVTDGIDPTPVSFSWTVDSLIGNTPPSVTNPGARSSEEGSAALLQIVATDADGDPLTYSATGLPPTLTINQSTGLITGTTTTAGNYSVTVTVSDGMDPTAVGFTWTVDPSVAGTLIHRINSGGRAGPGWDPDLASSPSPYSNVASASSQTFTVTRQIDGSHASLTPGTPIGPFRSHRVDPAQGAEMTWSFPVSSGSYRVRLYFAETLFTQAGQRIFDVTLEGAPFIDDLDVHAFVGADAGLAFAQTVAVADGTLDIDFSRVVGDPMVSGVAVEALSGGGAQWQTLPSSNGSQPAARHENAYVESGGLFYLLGGRGIKPVNIFDPVTATWTNGAAPPIELHHFQAVSYAGKIYVVSAFTGGFPNEVPVDSVYVYDPALNQWSVGASIPVNRRRGSAGAVVVNNSIYVVGGILNGHLSGHVAWLDVFDPVTGNWTPLADAPRARDHFHAGVVNGKLYAAGGRNTGLTSTFGDTIQEVDIYDLTTGQWSTLAAPLPTERAAAAVAVVGQDLWVIGGESAASSDAHAETEILDTSTGIWTAGSPLVEDRHGTQAIVFGNNVYIVAGSGVQGGGQELVTQEVHAITQP